MGYSNSADSLAGKRLFCIYAKAAAAVEKMDPAEFEVPMSTHSSTRRSLVNMCLMADLCLLSYKYQIISRVYHHPIICHSQSSWLALFIATKRYLQEGVGQKGVPRLKALTKLYTRHSPPHQFSITALQLAALEIALFPTFRTSVLDSP